MTSTWKIPSRVALLCAASLLSPLTGTAATALATALVQGGAGQRADLQSFDGVVEPVRQATLAAQVAGSIVSLSVKVGDTVRAGQELARIDARAAGQIAQASAAQVDAARANLTVAGKDFERQQQLLQKQYISQAALERSKAQFDAAQAQVKALQAQSDAAQTQQRFFVIQAPFAGVVSDVPVTVGDMAMPGRPLLTLHDPSSLRVTASVAQSALPASLDKLQFELPGWSGATGLMNASGATVLPLVDAATHSTQIRFNLPALKGVAPGMFARVWLPAAGGAAATGERLFVPTSAVVRRAELTALYLVDAQGRPALRQVRLGRVQGDRVEVLSGVRAGDKVATDPTAAAQVR
jgi:RND family efflux transporter MFP subunit